MEVASIGAPRTPPLPPPRSQGPGVPSCCPGALWGILGTEAAWGKQLSCLASLSWPRCPSAERVTSLGKDWHRPCLKCEKCGKTLTSGGHAEHEGKPYCNHPCYASMFGPKGFGRGGAESHTFK
uniref:LIM zinc-binding domain-containing protein n=1 Tax=Ursus maritimus TaxID=29073 RepID=A0A452VKA0_URSMA